MLDLNEVLDRLASDESVKIVVFESAVKDFFVAHADIVPNAESKAPLMHPDYPTLPYLFGVVQKLAVFPVPTIALVEGRARGGGFDIIMACDMRFGVEGHTKLSPIEIRAMLASGSTFGIINSMGLGRASEWIYSGHDMEADVAEKSGILNKSFATSEEARKYIGEYCATINTLPGHSMRETKEMVSGMMYPLSRMEEYCVREMRLITDPRLAEVLPKLIPLMTREKELDLPANLMSVYE